MGSDRPPLWEGYMSPASRGDVEHEERKIYKCCPGCCASDECAKGSDRCCADAHRVGVGCGRCERMWHTTLLGETCDKCGTDTRGDYGKLAFLSVLPLAIAAVVFWFLNSLS